MRQQSRLGDGVLDGSRAEGKQMDSSQTHENASFEHRKNGFDRKLAAICIVLGFLGLVSGYLEYVVYPSIMTNQYGETQISIHFSILTYWLSANRCLAPNSCIKIQGVPALDFAQLFFLLVVITVVYHFAKLKM